MNRTQFLALAEGVKPLEQVEREHCLAVLDRMAGSVTRAAEALGIGRTTLIRKLKMWNSGEPTE